MAWFIKTEQFRSPRQAAVADHLEAHRRWVTRQRRSGRAMASGYLVDEHRRPGGGGLLLLEAESYGEALAVVRSDPMVASGCVDWQLQGWIPVVGNVAVSGVAMDNGVADGEPSGADDATG